MANLGKKINPLFTPLLVGFLASLTLPAQSLWMHGNGFFILIAFVPLFLSLEWNFQHLSRPAAFWHSLLVCFFSAWAVELGFFHWGVAGIETFLALPRFWATAMASAVLAVHALAILPAFLVYIVARSLGKSRLVLLGALLLMPVAEHWAPRLFYFNYGSFLSLTPSAQGLFGAIPAAVLTAVALVFSWAFSLLFQRNKDDRVWGGALCAAVVVILGLATLQGTSPASQAYRALRLLLVQPALELSKQFVDPALVGDPLERQRLEHEMQHENLRILSTLTRTGIEEEIRSTGKPPDLIVWPESVVPVSFHLDQKLKESLQAALESFAVPLLLQYSTIPRKLPPEFLREIRLVPHRAPMLPEASLAEIRFPGGGDEPEPYQKTFLMPYGEYLPARPLWQALLPQSVMHRMPRLDRVPRIGNSLPLSFGDWRLGVSICFDGIMPNLAREHVIQGADLLINMSNLEWMGSAASENVYRSIVRLRALETGKPLVFVNNSGGTGAFDGHGERLMDPMPHGVSMSQTITVPLDTPEILPSPKVPYLVWGDGILYGLGCLGAALVTIGLSSTIRERPSNS